MFGLRKWYFDCVTAPGEVGMVYAGRVSFGRLGAPFFELMASPECRPVTRLRRVPGRARLTVTDRELALEGAPSGITGRWKSQHASIGVSLLDDERGRIEWHCHQPGGHATLLLPDGSILDGLGYTEELEMTVTPWAMPFEELRWGRFVSEHRSVVWIDWRGGLDRRWVFADGAVVAASVVERDRVAWPGASVEMAPGRVWRHGRIGRTVAGVLGPCLPRRLSHAIETKWISRGTLQEGRGTTDTGWVIHELVQWG